MYIAAPLPDPAPDLVSDPPEARGSLRMEPRCVVLTPCFSVHRTVPRALDLRSYLGLYPPSIRGQVRPRIPLRLSSGGGHREDLFSFSSIETFRTKLGNKRCLAKSAHLSHEGTNLPDPVPHHSMYVHVQHEVSHLCC